MTLNAAETLAVVRARSQGLRQASSRCYVAVSIHSARFIIDRSLRKSAMLMAMRIRNMAIAAAASAIIMSTTTSSILI